ncbi:MAG: hypothetical protein QXK37_06555 [Candidatus Woesearchaeota archaeon]
MVKSGLEELINGDISLDKEGLAQKARAFIVKLAIANIAGDLFHNQQKYLLDGTGISPEWATKATALIRLPYAMAVWNIGYFVYQKAPWLVETFNNITGLQTDELENMVFAYLAIPTAKHITRYLLAHRNKKGYFDPGVSFYAKELIWPLGKYAMEKKKKKIDKFKNILYKYTSPSVYSDPDSQQSQALQAHPYLHNHNKPL